MQMYLKNGNFRYVGTPQFIYNRLMLLGKNPTTETRFSEFLIAADVILKEEADKQLLDEKSPGKRKDLKSFIEIGFPTRTIEDKAKEIAINELLELWTSSELTAKDIIE
jgi:hypothetical protein